MQFFQFRLILLVKRLRRRLRLAITTVPTAKDAVLIVQLLGIYALVATPLALMSGLTTVNFADLTWPQQGLVATRVLVFPAFIEEGIWRVLWLPHKTERVSDRQR
ncbi:MAG: hypothetical protein AAGG53_14975 [Cyanobacteria bacterium P01_H01_bin.152]